MKKNNLSIITQSQVTPWPIQAAPIPPQITLNGTALVPKTPPISPVGFQLLFLAKSTATVLSNQYYSLDPTNWSWYDAYLTLYQTMLNDLNNSEFLKAGNVFVMASFGIGVNLTPPSAFYEFLKLNGGGAGLDYWVKTADPGSEMDNHNFWMEYPAYYVLVGNVGDADVNVETFDFKFTSDLAVTLKSTLYYAF